MMDAAASGQPLATIDVASMGSPPDSRSANSHSSTGQAPQGIEGVRCCQ
jgi:hypothetical protein